MSSPEPSTGLIISGVKTAGTGVWKLWRLHIESRETGDLLRSALAWAICPNRQYDEDVQNLAALLEQHLRRTAVPRSNPSLPQRVRDFGRRLVPWKVKVRQQPEALIFGSSFQEHLEVWLRDSLARPEVEVSWVPCHNHRCDLDSVVARFPYGFEEKLLGDDLDASAFRERLAGKILLADVLRDKRRSRLAVIDRFLLASAQAVAPGGAAFGVAQLAGADQTTAIAAGLGVAAIGALSGGLARDRSGEAIARSSVVRGMALEWVAELIGDITGQQPSPRSSELRGALIRAMGGASWERATRSGVFVTRLPVVGDLRQLAEDAEDRALERALGQVERTWSGSGESGFERLPALGALIDLYNVGVSPIV